MSEQTESTSEETRYVYDGNISRLQERVEKLNKRAARLGVPEIRLELGERETVYTCSVDYGPAVSNDPRAWDRPHSMSKLVVHAHERCTAELAGEPPRLAGWSFVAVIDHLSNGAVTRYPLCEVEVDLKQFRGADATCDHCQTKRQRHETFVVVHEDGRLMRVGRNCIADFLGHQDPAKLIGHLNIWASIFAELDDCYEGGMGTGERRLYLAEFLAHVAREMRQNGWLSRGKAYEQGSVHFATADCAETGYWDALAPGLLSRNRREQIQTTKEDAERGAKAIEWVRALTDVDVQDSDYLWNLRAVCQDDHIRPKKSGLAASVIVSAERAFEKALEREREAQKSNEHLGSKKERLTLELTLVAYRELESDWGVSCMHRFEDPAGNCLVWFATNPSFIPVDKYGKRGMEVGETLTLAATVKAHDEYKGRKQTKVTRVALPKVKKAKKVKK
jgi:hypothetical protein